MTANRTVGAATTCLLLIAWLGFLLCQIGYWRLCRDWTKESNDLPPTHRKIEKTEPKRKVIVIFAQERTGSKFFGEYFNRRSDVYYLFDPLHGERFGDAEAPIRQKILSSLLSCNFSTAMNVYTNTANKKWGNCRSGICFPGQSQFLWRNTRLCTNKNAGSNCNNRLDQMSLEKVCRQSLMIATKIIGMNRLSELEPILADPSLDVKVIHLVRDPRPVVASWLKAAVLGYDKAAEMAKRLCDHYGLNIAYIKMCIFGEGSVQDLKDPQLSCNRTIKDLWKGRFIRISHEYVSEDPMRALDTVYKFAELNYDENVEKWLKENTAYKPIPGQNDPTKQAFGTNRDSKAVISAWRTRETFQHVQLMQKPCIEVMDQFGYAPVYNEHEQRNMSVSVYDLKKILILL